MLTFVGSAVTLVSQRWKCALSPIWKSNFQCLQDEVKNQQGQRFSTATPRPTAVFTSMFVSVSVSVSVSVFVLFRINSGPSLTKQKTFARIDILLFYLKWWCFTKTEALMLTKWWIYNKITHRYPYFLLKMMSLYEFIMNLHEFIWVYNECIWIYNKGTHRYPSFPSETPTRFCHQASFLMYTQNHHCLAQHFHASIEIRSSHNPSCVIQNSSFVMKGSSF